jgi:hypothetical protein
MGSIFITKIVRYPLLYIYLLNIDVTGVVKLRNEIFITIVILILVTILCGCIKETPTVNSITPIPTVQIQNQSSLNTVLIYGHVYLNGEAISNARVEAISANKTDCLYNITNDYGIYTLNIKPDTNYNITASYQGLQHTIWPVYYLPEAMEETNLFDINLTTIPSSTIDGSGYTLGSGPLGERYNHTRWSGFFIDVRSVKDNTTISATTDSNGNYSLTVEPNILYNISGYSRAHDNYPIATFYYRNYIYPFDSYFYGNYPQIIVGPNETALINYVIVVP